MTERINDQAESRFARHRQLIGTAATHQTVSIGPGSLLYEHGGDKRTYLVGGSHGVLQLMHPTIAEAVDTMSVFWNNPAKRLVDSIPNIIGTIYDPDFEETGRKVHDFHKNIGGERPDGSRWHALNPDAFAWAHSTFIKGMFDTLEKYTDVDLPGVKKEQLYAEMIVWYERYGMKAEHLPATVKDFDAYWDAMIAEELEYTPAARRAIELAENRAVVELPGIPKVIMQLGRVPVGEIVRLTTIGNLPEVIRERFDIPWTDKDQKHLDSLGKASRKGWKFVPSRLRDQPRARQGKRAVEKNSLASKSLHALSVELSDSY